MTTQSPLIWGTCCFATGIAAGFAFPAYPYLPIAVAMLVAARLLWRWRIVCHALLLLAWMGLGATRANLSVSQIETWTENINERASALNESLVQRLQDAGLSCQATALSASITLGNRKNLTRQTRELFSRTGSSHLLALSGMHLGVLYGMLHLLLFRHIPLQKRRRILPFIALPLIWGYTFLAGLPPSLVRASVMLSCCIVLFRVPDDSLTLHRLALCVFLMLVLSPSYIFQLSFWLSLAAVFFILSFYLPIQKRWGLGGIGGMLLLSMVAQIGTMPLSIYYFHTLPLLGAFWSVVLIPLTSAMMCATLATLAIPCAITSWILNNLTDLYLYLIKGMSIVPHCVLENLYPSVLQVVLLYALLLCITLRLHAQLKQEESQKF